MKFKSTFIFKRTLTWSLAFLPVVASAADLFDPAKVGSIHQVASNLIQCNDEMGNAFIHTTEDVAGLRLLVTANKVNCQSIMKSIKERGYLEVKLEKIGEVQNSPCTKPAKKFQEIKASTTLNGKNYSFTTISAESGYTTSCSTP